MLGSAPGPMADVMRRWISAPIRSRAARTAGSAPPPSNAVVQAAATSGSSAATSARWCNTLFTRVGIGCVDVGEVRDLPDQVEINLGDQVVLRREIGVGGSRGDFGSRRHHAHRQVGVGILAQRLQAGRKHLAEGFLLAAVAWRCGLRGDLGAGHGQCIAGHMSKLEDSRDAKQAHAAKTQVIDASKRPQRSGPCTADNTKAIVRRINIGQVSTRWEREDGVDRRRR